MPLAAVSNSVQLQYEDSGPPSGSATYTTLVFFHGVYFNAGIYKRMFPFAVRNNMRMVALHSRDNAQSTPYTEDELKMLAADRPRKEREAFLQQRAIEHAKFIQWFIEHESLPPLRESGGQRIGGVSLVAWSGGNSLGITFFVYANKFPQHTKEVLEKNLRSYVIYDSPMYPLGLEIPPLDELYNPIRDPACSPENLMALFLPGLVGYYNNDGPLTYKTIEATKLDDLPSRREFCTSLKWAPEPCEVNAADFDPISEVATLNRSALPILTLGREIYADGTSKLVNDAEFAETNFPKMTVECVYASKGLSETLYGMYGLKKMVLERDSEGRRGRRVRFHMLEGANHMWHWLNPEATAAFFAGLYMGY